MLVLLKHFQIDLQSLQAPCLTFTLIVIKALCFFPIWFWGSFYFLGDHAAGACRAFPFGQGQLGSQPGAGRIEVPSAGPGVIPHQAISWQQHQPRENPVPCAFHLWREGIWWEWRQWCLCNSCTRVCQHRSQDAFSHSAEQVPFSYPPVDNRLCLHGFKTWLLSCATAREIGKNIYLCWHT